MTIVFAVLVFCVGLFIIVKGGDILVRAALSLNKITGINPIIIGATFVSVATTLPEVFVSIFAVMADNHGIAVGNAIGAMIANIALVFGIYVAFMSVRVKRRDILTKSIFILVTIAIVILFSVNLRLSLVEGVVLLGAFVLFLIYNVRESRNRDERIPECTPVLLERQQPCLTPQQRKKEIAKITAGFIAGQAMLVVGAFTIVEYGERLAHMFGMSEAVVGFTIIAIGTSLPELITTFVSIRKKTAGLALGNVIGANVINCTLLLGTCGVIGGIKGSFLPISKDTLLISLPVLFGFTLIAILPMLIKQKTYRWQGILLLLLYAVYIGYLVIVQPI